jgi:hypothetical protein
MEIVGIMVIRYEKDFKNSQTGGSPRDHSDTYSYTMAHSVTFLYPYGTLGLTEWKLLIQSPY